ncbi:hypothetical protein [Effusibacillus lacus]|uniref:Uncharacterized protein n=1 Tax=Effusibacillus lacus TaxID=1348429 RepID=A0A292YS91_9BACL|nr:hypothetical protein [Effusibacillus lacus]TCS76250.1 hypothetical protein EDD64_10314 [Effusibacillus lacus]GAX91799.1 hypothetical protein EFBL_3490 [Effusibacillus lacus]
MSVHKNESPATHLLISMLIRYPEVSSVRYDPNNRSLIFTFFLQGKLDQARQSACMDNLRIYFDTCANFDRHFPPLGELVFMPLEDITVVTYEQLVNRVSTSEIHLLTAVLQDHFAKQVALDPLMIEEEDLEMQEELINRLLDHRGILEEQQQIVAYREGGKVFVYNR